MPDALPKDPFIVQSKALEAAGIALKVVNSVPAPLKSIAEEAGDWMAALIRRGRELGLVRSDIPDDLLVELIWAMDFVHDRWLGAHWKEMDQGERNRTTNLFVSFLKRIQFFVFWMLLNRFKQTTNLGVGAHLMCDSAEHSQLYAPQFDSPWGHLCFHVPVQNGGCRPQNGNVFGFL